MHAGAHVEPGRRDVGDVAVRGAPNDDASSTFGGTTLCPVDVCSSADQVISGAVQHDARCRADFCQEPYGRAVSDREFFMKSGEYDMRAVAHL